MSMKIAEALIPPSGDQDPSSWRWKVWATIMSIIAVLTFHIVADKGLVSGIDAVAHESDIKGIEDKLKTVERNQNVALRLQLAAEICRVLRQRDAEPNANTRRLLGNSFGRLQEDYADVNQGSRYSTAECSTKE